MEAAIHSINRYTISERHEQVIYVDALLFCAGGLDYMDIRFPGAEKPLAMRGADIPFIALLPAGTSLDFSFGKKRENWVMFCKLSKISWSNEKKNILVDSEYGILQFPLLKAVHVEQCDHFRSVFQNIYNLRRSGTPADLLAADGAAAALFCEFFALPDKEEKDSGDSTADTLMEIIRSDTAFVMSLQQIYSQCGRSPNCLRKSFKSKFQVSPEDYRLRLKMDTILRLIDEDSFSLKEIAAAVGMRNVTHLNSFVLARCGISPGQLQKQRRGRPMFRLQEEL